MITIRMIIIMIMMIIISLCMEIRSFDIPLRPN